MRTIRFVTPEGLPALLAHLAQTARVLVPTEKPADKQSVVFEPWEADKPFTLAKATVSPKGAALPACETLVRYKKAKDPENPERVTLQLDDTPEGAEPTVVFACRSCDARGFAILDKPFLKGPYADPYYKARREQLTVFTLTCNTGCNTCFCHWVGGGPASPMGSDVLMTEIEGGYVLQAVSPKGDELLAATPLEDGAPYVDKMKAVREAANASLVPPPVELNVPEVRDRVAARFTDAEFWQRETERCLSCGACTYFCPTCYCFNITDEGEGVSEKGGRRLRSWDNCMSSLFTREASGHNPRTLKAFRMRNRVSHKYATYPENWGSFSCSGCGRCIGNCPVNLDIRAIVLDAVRDDKAGAGKDE